MRFRRVAPIALTAVLVAGCTSDGGGPSGKPSGTVPPPSTSSIQSTPSSPTPSVATTGPNVRPGEKPPVLSAAGRRNDAAGAITFAQFWFLALDWAYATMDTTLLVEHEAKSCSDCALLVSVFAQRRAKSEHFIGGRVHLVQTVIADNDHRYGASQAIDVSISQDSLKTVSNSGGTVSTGKATKKITFRLWLRRDGDAWTVVQKGHVVRV